MWMAATFLAMAATAVVFWFFAPLRLLFDAFQPMTVSLGIFAAALLVRLNRGMPTFDWKGHLGDRKRTTAAVVSITREYIAILAALAVLLVALVGLTAVRSVVMPPARQVWPTGVEQSVSAAIGAMVAFCLVRMAYVVWRDYDVVRTQKDLIDQAGDREEADRQSKVAEGKVKSMKGANLRTVHNGDPKAWQS